MKAKFLKIAGVKSEKEFYKKYPTEAAFFKAHPEAKKQVKKAQIGAYIGEEDETVETDYSPINFADMQNQAEYLVTGEDPTAYDYSDLYETNPLSDLSSSIMDAGKAYDEAMAESAKKGKRVKKAADGFSGFLENMGGAQGLAGAATGIIGGIQQLKAQKQAVKSAEQASKVSDVAAQAAATRPEIPSRKYKGLCLMVQEQVFLQKKVLRLEAILQRFRICTILALYIQT